MMGDNEAFDSIYDNTITKVFVLLKSIKDSKYKYIEIINPKTEMPIMKIKMNLDDDSMVDFLDTFFDEGFKVNPITKEDFDSLESNDILKYNI